MSFDEAFEQRSLVALILKECIRNRGYTKVSFANKVNIPYLTLDNLLNGIIDDKYTFYCHLQKVLKALNMSEEALLLYRPTSIKSSKEQYFAKNTKVNKTAKKQFDLLLDIIDLCEIYY